MRASGLLFLFALAACGREPSFDERYEATEQEIREKAAEMNEELLETQKDPVATERVNDAVADAK